MRFYLGTHETAWLGTAGIDLFVSHRRLARRRSLPRAIAPWALDSGGFTELNLHGRWTMNASDYIEAVKRYEDEIGLLQWAAPMDWMCEPVVIEQTGLSVREHQERTVANFVALRDVGPFVPVIQGWTIADYFACIDLYQQAGVDLHAEPLVGLGSVCRRQATSKIAGLVRELAGAGLSLHGFGMKLGAFKTDVPLNLVSADSLAWSYNARRNPPLPSCSHKSCSSCLRWAMAWRCKVLASLAAPQQTAFVFPALADTTEDTK